MNIRALGAIAFLSVFLMGCGPRIHNSRTFEAIEPNGEIPPVDSGKCRMEINITSTYREVNIPIFYEYRSWLEPFYILITITYVPIWTDFDSSDISLESVRLIDQDSNAFEMMEGKNQKAFIEYLHYNLPSAPLPLGNTQIRLKVPITEEYVFKRNGVVKVQVKLKSRKTGSIEVFEKRFRSIKRKKVMHMLQAINIC